MFMHNAKTMGFIYKYALRTKILLDNKVIEQASLLGHDVGYDVGDTLAKFQSICGTIGDSLLRKTRKEMCIRDR